MDLMTRLILLDALEEAPVAPPAMRREKNGQRWLDSSAARTQELFISQVQTSSLAAQAASLPSTVPCSCMVISELAFVVCQSDENLLSKKIAKRERVDLTDE